MIVRCPSNGRSASSTSGPLGPAAQSSAGRAAWSCLPSPAELPLVAPSDAQVVTGAARRAFHRRSPREPPRPSPSRRMVVGGVRWLALVDSGMSTDEYGHWRAPRSKAGGGFCDLVIWFALSADLKSFFTLTLSPLFDFLFQLWLEAPTRPGRKPKWVPLPQPIWLQI